MREAFFAVNLVSNRPHRGGIAEMSTRAQDSRRELPPQRARRSHEDVADIETGRNPGDQAAAGLVVSLPYHRPHPYLPVSPALVTSLDCTVGTVNIR